MRVVNTSIYEVYSDKYIKIHYLSKIFYFYQAAQMCTSIWNNREFAYNVMWKIFIKNRYIYFIDNLSLISKPEAPLHVMHTFVHWMYDFYALSWKCYKNNLLQSYGNKNLDKCSTFFQIPIYIMIIVRSHGLIE